jgi:hypothetical protein
MTLALFNSSRAAENLKRRLVDAGFSASVHDRLRLEKLWFVSKQETGAHIEVPSEQFEGACQTLQQWNKQDSLEAAIRCPHCKSFRIEYPQLTRKSFIPNILLGLAAKLGFVEKDFYCKSCQYTWPRDPSQREHKKPHSAPGYFIEGLSISPKQEIKRSSDRKSH